MQIRSNMEQAEIFVFIASFFLIALGFKEPGPNPSEHPPIILFPESSGYNFRSGRAELSSEFRDHIRTKLKPKILEVVKQYKDIDAIEVIGHTDGRPTVS